MLLNLKAVAPATGQAAVPRFLNPRVHLHSAAPAACNVKPLPTAQTWQVAAMLNGQQMGGKRRSAYFYDLWCIKYLPKFKWDHLTGGLGGLGGSGDGEGRFRQLCLTRSCLSVCRKAGNAHGDERVCPATMQPCHCLELFCALRNGAEQALLLVVSLAQAQPLT
jgi:hypothetical protein